MRTPGPGRTEMTAPPPVEPPPRTPVEPPPRTPISRQSRRGTFLFGSLYLLMLIAGVAIGFRAGSPKPTSPGKPTLVAANKPDPAPPVQAPPEEGQGSRTQARRVEEGRVQTTEPDPKPKAEPRPEKKPEPEFERHRKSPSRHRRSPARRCNSRPWLPCSRINARPVMAGWTQGRARPAEGAKAAIAGATAGPASSPAGPGYSLIWQSIRDGTMPPKNKPQLTAAEKKLIKDWIAGGRKQAHGTVVRGFQLTAAHGPPSHPVVLHPRHQETQGRPRPEQELRHRLDLGQRHHACYQKHARGRNVEPAATVCRP